MIRSKFIHGLLAAGALALGGLALQPQQAAHADAAAAAAEPAAYSIVAMRRITEAQYRNSIADIFGSEIRVAGRFEPIVRPVHEMIASGAREASISPSGLEQFDAMARVIAAQVFDETHRPQFVPCKPKDANQADADCASQVLAPLGRQLFRRPLTTSEQAFYAKLASDAAARTGSFYKGLELSLAAMLVSPNYLYVIEVAEPDPAHPGQLRLDNWSRASRLSFMLWNSTPNEALLQAAAQGKLTDQAELSAIAGRMVQSPRFEQGVRAFFSDMLLFEKFDELAKDPIIYPYFTQEVAQALPEQLLRTITGHLLTDNGDYRQLFTTNRTFLTRALGGLYQVQVHKSQGWERHEFAPGDDRAGVLGQAGFLAIYSHSGRSSPTLRGKAIRELLMCQAVPPPPGNVNFTAVQDTGNKAMPTARIRLDAHNTDPVCAACHKITDPIGLPLERFDGIGAFRTMENEAPIDVSGAMDGSSFSGADGLGKAIAASPATTQCVSSRTFEYATGRPSQDEDLISAIDRAFAASGYNIRALFQRVASMPEAYRISAGPVSSEPTHVSLLDK